MPIPVRLVLLVLFWMLMPLRAQAQRPVYLWGVQRGCERLPDTDRYVEKRIHTPDRPVALLHTTGGKPLPACQGAACGELLRRACPAAGGVLVGGQVSQGRDLTRMRLWLYDLSSGQLAWQDDYSENLAFDGAVVTQVRALIANPRFGPAPGDKPAYCTSARAERNEPESKGPIFLTVYGDGKHKAALLSAVREQLQLLGRTVLPVAAEARSSSLDLQKIVSGQQNARVLGAEVKKDGTVDLFFYDQKTNRTTDKSVPKPRLNHDETASSPSSERDSLIVAVKQAVSELLESCFSDQCASSGIQPPVEACEAFAEGQCGGLGDLGSPGMSLPARHIDPTTAKIFKGAIWPIFAGSAAAAIGLGIANSFIVVERDGRRYADTLIQPAATLGVVAGVSLALAIPATIASRRAERLVQSSPTNDTPMAMIQCPN